jgi:K+-transporting ATPase KdpF subunit
VRICAFVLALHEGLRQALGTLSLHKKAITREGSMDYIIAGVTSLGLFVYLIYALLRPEKF